MSHPTTGFDATWLQQREPLDLAARSAALAHAFAAALPRDASRPLRIVDLAAGTGANFRALAPMITGHQHWLLTDHDPLLLAAQPDAIATWAAQRGWRTEPIDGGLLVHAGTARWQVQQQALDLAGSLDELALAAFDGVVTTAFLDLVSAAWADDFSARLTQARRPLLATLTVDGRREWHPPLPDDATLQAAFAQHQAGDKGFGLALGPQAASHLAQRLAHAGMAVHTARSDWLIGAAHQHQHLHQHLLQRLVDEAATVATQARPDLAARAQAWRAQRLHHQRRGELRLTVGHVDLLALPG